MNALNKEILRLAIPSILANITIPLVGMVGTAVAGHLPAEDGLGAATFIGAISVGAMLFNLLYWNFSFLRTGTGGLTAQAFGRGDMHECARIFVRGICLAAGVALVTLALQIPFVSAALWVVQGSPEVESLARRYFMARIWAAPATLSLMAFSGWFVGMQDSVSSMGKDLVVNGVNIVASLILSLGIGGWKGLGFIGIPIATVIAQYSGLLFCICVCVFKYHRKVFCHFKLNEVRDILGGSEIRSFLKMNVDLFVRSLGFTAIYIGYTMLAAKFGDLMLACSSIIMQLLMLFSYFTDGFAYAGEALTGRFIGAQDKSMVRRTVKYIFWWSMSIAVLFVGIYMAGGMPLLRILTSDPAVVEACRQFLPWLVFMPPLGCAAFTWDGIYLGAAAARPIRDAMVGSALSFFGVWYVCKGLLHFDGALAIHILMAAYFAHLIFRTVWLTALYGRSILERPFKGGEFAQ